MRSTNGEIMQNTDVKYVGFWLRGAALLVDQMIIGFMLGLVMVLLTIFTLVTSIDSIKDTVEQTKIDIEQIKTNAANEAAGVDEGNSEQQEAEDIIAQTIENDPTLSKIDTLFGPVYYLLYIIASILYHAFCEASRFQGSIAKYALRIKVTQLNGDAMTFKLGLVRNSMAWVLGILTLGVCHMIAGWNKRKRALHDMIAGTVVVMRPRY